MTLLRVLTIPLCLALLAACGSPDGSPPVGSPPVGADALVFRLDEIPGLLGPGSSPSLPRMTLFGDGTLVLADPAPAGLPAPTQRHLTPAGIQRLLTAAAEAGLTRSTDYGTPQIADASTSVFTVVTATQQVTKVIAPTYLDGLPDPQRSARSRLQPFLTNLQNLDTWLTPEIATPQPYPYGQVALFALPQDPNPGAPEQPWPLTDLTTGEPSGLTRCQILPTPTLETLRPTLTPTTQWRSGPQLFHLTLRPLLPNEHTCHDLTA